MNRRFIRTPLRHGVAPKAVRKPQRCVVAASTSACPGAGPCRNSPPFVLPWAVPPALSAGGARNNEKWPARGRGFGAASPKKPAAGVRGRSPRLDGGGYQQSEGYVSETAPLRSYSVKFFLSPFTCLPSLVQLQCEVSSLTLCSWVFSCFQFRYIYPCLHNQPLQVSCYSVKFLLSSESDWDGCSFRFVGLA